MRKDVGFGYFVLPMLVLLFRIGILASMSFLLFRFGSFLYLDLITLVGATLHTGAE